MVARESLNELRQVRDAFRWEFRGDIDQIRGFLRTGETGTSFNPITALAFIRSGRAFAHGDWLRASRIVGLTETDADAIVDAANNCLWTYIDDELVLNAYNEWFRTELIEAIGLESDFDLPAEAVELETPVEVIAAANVAEAELHHV